MSPQAQIFGLLFYLLLLLGGVSAWQDRFLTVTQMRQKGFSRGLPWLWHGGMIGDIVLITPLCIVAIQSYGDQWNVVESAMTSVICGFVSYALHVWYDNGARKSGIPESHTYLGKRTLSGWFHLFYMALALTVIVLLFVFTESVETGFLVWSTIILVTHMFFGTHCHLKIIRPSWYPVRIKIVDALTLVAIGLVLAGLTYNATH